MDLIRISTNSTFCDANIITVNRYSRDLLFTSIIGEDSKVNSVLSSIKKGEGFHSRTNLGGVKTSGAAFDVYKDKHQDSGYTHALVKRKDTIEDNEDGSVNLSGYVFYRGETVHFRNSNNIDSLPEDFLNAVYSKLYESMPIPLLEEWRTYVVKELIEGNHLTLSTTYGDTSNFSAYQVNVNSNRLTEIVLSGIEDGKISIKNATTTSDTLSNISGMDDYLTAYSSILSEGVRDSFQPKFTPTEDAYGDNLEVFSDYTSYHGIDLYEPQKVVAEASARNLDKHKSSLVIAQQGSGKTIIGTSIVYAHAKKRNTTNIVICPGHLVEKWAEEINSLSPLSTAIVVDDFSHFRKLEPLIYDKRRRKHLFLIISKDTAKTSYEERPSAVWSLSKNTFCCPKCGGKLTKKVTATVGNRRVRVDQDLEPHDFNKKYAFNQVCSNDVPYWSLNTGEWEDRPCDEKLWEPFIKEESQTGKWLRLPRSQGWVMKDHVASEINRLEALSEAGGREYTRAMARYLDALTEAENMMDNEEKIQMRAPRKFSLATYIKKFHKNKIDYLIADEIHKFKGGDSLQGQAFGELVQASKKVIGLTGTLLNGYANSLFYILYRLFPAHMKREGFDYTDERSFSRQFGVVRYTNRFDTTGGQAARIGSTNEKFLPGISPLVFTKFLLEYAVFVNLEDISSEMPDYNEHPIEVEMTGAMRENYEQIETNFRNTFSNHSDNKLSGTMVQMLSMYPDQPYGHENVRHPDTGREVVEIPNLEDNLLHPKEEALIKLCKSIVDKNEKVLVYYHWTNSSNVIERVSSLLREEGLRVTVLKSNTTSTRNRQAWIEERADETDVLICNPTLVETGLDLLDYRSIVFYQLGYDIFTMRQASRRSYRLNQDKDVNIYFMYYKDTIQEQTLSLMATKLQASQAIEGNFSEEGLHALSDNEDLLTQVANSVIEGIKHEVDVDVFANTQERRNIMSYSSSDDIFDSFLDDIDVVEEEEEVEEKYELRVKPLESTFSIKDFDKPKNNKRKRRNKTRDQLGTELMVQKLREEPYQVVNFF